MKSCRIFVALAIGATLSVVSARGQTAVAPSPCEIRQTVFDGWQAQEVSNDWLKLTFVPQLGGRLMQVIFNGHAYLFVNPQFKGKYVSPTEAAGRWINYGGDKIWPLPEGNDDEHHWTGASTALDDGSYTLTILPKKNRCTVRLEGPPDAPTGLQYTREIGIGNDSPEISFHAFTKNFTGHSIDWSVQSVSQYDLRDARDATQYNHDFWAFTPISSHSSYLLGYHVRDGLANDPSYSVKGDFFRVNYRYLEGEVWIDSTSGWLAVVDGATQYAMLERTKYTEGAPYPGKASVIFYKNGPTVELNAKGVPYLSSMNLEETPYYMEAELNSPMIELAPGETYTMESSWFPTRMSDDLHTVTDAGLVGRPLSAARNGENINLSGSFGVFFSGALQAHLYGEGGSDKGLAPLQAVRPEDKVELRAVLPASKDVVRVSVHLIDRSGVDRGSLGEVFVSTDDGGH